MRLLHFISIVTFAVATSASLIDIRDSCSRGVCSTTINCCPDLACTIDPGRKIGVCILCYKETNSPIHELYRHANEGVHTFRKYHHIQNVEGSPGKGWIVEMMEAIFLRLHSSISSVYKCFWEDEIILCVHVENFIQLIRMSPASNSSTYW